MPMFVISQHPCHRICLTIRRKPVGHEPFPLHNGMLLPVQSPMLLPQPRASLVHPARRCIEVERLSHRWPLMAMRMGTTRRRMGTILLRLWLLLGRLVVVVVVVAAVAVAEVRAWVVVGVMKGTVVEDLLH